MNIKEIDKIKEGLIQRRERLLQDLEDLSKRDSREIDNRTADFPEYGDKPDENAQEISEYSTVVVAQKVLEKSIEEIDGALKRIEDNTYGICKYCGGEIGDKRLEARPTASSCIDCKTKLQEND
ncbi:MAG: TraR/DksA family transcriptional regulator [Patescibacteria group bacterium]|jgi:DnaK suppressor protein